MNGFVDWLLADSASLPRTVAVAVVRITILLAVAWVLHALLLRHHPRWRTMLWRGCCLGVVGIVIASQIQLQLDVPLLPALSVAGPTYHDSDAVLTVAASSESGGIAQLDDPQDSPQLVPTVPVASEVLTEFELLQLGALEGQAQSESTSPASSFPWLICVAVIWVGGVVVLAFRWLHGLGRLSCIVQTALAVPSDIWLEAERSAQWLGYAGPITLLHSNAVVSPCSVGVLRPVILLPAGDSATLSGAELRASVAHELAHLQGHDLLWNHALSWISIVLWFHPLAWRIRVAHADDCDHLCDAKAARYLDDARGYCRVLATMALRVAGEGEPAALSMARPSSVKRRIEAVQRGLAAIRVPRWRLALAVSLVIFGIVCIGTVSLKRAIAETISDATTANSQLIEANPEDLDDQLAKDALAPSTAVSGTVVDDRGDPAGEVTITAHLVAGGKAIATSDPDGRFHLSVPTEQSRGALLIATSSHNTSGFTQLPFDQELTRKYPDQRIELGPERAIDVVVEDSDHHPKAGASVSINSMYVTVAQGETNKDGRIKFIAPSKLPLQFILAQLAGTGVDYMLFRSAEEPVNDPYKLAPAHRGDIRLVLSPTRTMTVKVVDQEGTPIPGATVSPWYIHLPQKGDHANLGGLWSQTTNEQGLATFESIPVEHERNLTIWVRKDGLVAQDRTMVDPRSPEAEVTATLLPLQLVKGSVALPDGKPAAGIHVHVAGDGYGTDGFSGGVVTQADGTFEIKVDPDKYYVFAAADSQWASPLVARIVRLGSPVDEVELKAVPATRVFGKVNAGNDETPAVDRYVQLYLKESEDEGYYDLPEDQKLPNPKDSRVAIYPLIVQNVKTDEEGRFEFFAGPGDHYVISSDVAERPEFSVKGQKEIEVNLKAKQFSSGNVTGRLVLQSNKDQGVPEIRVFGYPLGDSMGNHFSATSDREGRFEARRLGEDQLVGAFADDAKLGAIIDLRAETATFVLELGPTATLQGTLIDDETGLPATDREIGASIQVGPKNGPWMSAFQHDDVTDENGRFEIIGLVPGREYEVRVVMERDSDGQARSWRVVGSQKPESAGLNDIGEVRLPVTKKPPTFEQRIAQYFDGDPVQKLQQKLADAALAYQQVLMIVGDSSSTSVHRFFEAKEDYEKANEPLRVAFADYMVIGVNSDQAEILDELGISAPNQGHATLAILAPDRKLVVQAGTDQLSAEGQLDRTALTEFLRTRRVPLPDAQQQFAHALEQATQENKRVLVQVSGPGCPPCVLLSRYLDEQKQLVAKDYVYLKLDTRMPHSSDVIKNIRKAAGGGVPWMAILSNSGEVLTTSDSEEGNIGYPSSKSGKAHFRKMVRDTRRQLSDEELTQLLKPLETDE